MGNTLEVNMNRKEETVRNYKEFLLNVEKNWDKYASTEQWFYWSKSQAYLKGSKGAVEQSGSSLH